MKTIADLSDKELNNFIERYRDRGVETGGKFSLAELNLERQRRIVSPFPPIETARVIVRLANESSDGLVSYKQVWETFRPGKTWTGHGSMAEISKALGSVIAYCIDNKLPILTTLVVQSDSRSHSKEAILNICNEARSLGLATGPDAEVFVSEQQIKARQLASHWENSPN